MAGIVVSNSGWLPGMVIGIYLFFFIFFFWVGGVNEEEGRIKDQLWKMADLLERMVLYRLYRPYRPPRHRDVTHNLLRTSIAGSHIQSPRIRFGRSSRLHVCNRKRRKRLLLFNRFCRKLI